MIFASITHFFLASRNGMLKKYKPLERSAGQQLANHAFYSLSEVN